MLAEGYSSLENEVAIIDADPLNCVWLPTDQPRTDRVVLEANTDHWNIERGPRLEKVVFRNDISPAEALDLVCTTEGEVDIVTEVEATDAQKVIDSEYAQLEAVDAMRVLVGIINRGAEDVPLPFDVLIHAWFDLTSDAPPAVLHREYYHSGGAFRVGPPIPEFEELIGR